MKHCFCLNRVGTASCIRRSREFPQATDHTCDPSKIRALERRTHGGSVIPTVSLPPPRLWGGPTTRRRKLASTDGSEAVHFFFFDFGETSVCSKRRYIAPTQTFFLTLRGPMQNRYHSSWESTSGVPVRFPEFRAGENCCGPYVLASEEKRRNSVLSRFNICGSSGWYNITPLICERYD